MAREPHAKLTCTPPKTCGFPSEEGLQAGLRLETRNLAGRIPIHWAAALDVVDMGLDEIFIYQQDT
jgi:hypothetical protein